MIASPLSLPGRAARYQIVFGVVALLAGAAGFVQARDVAFTASRGVALGWGSYELTLMSYNRLGALVTAALGLVGLAAGLSRRLRLGAFPAVGFAVIFVLGIFQVRASGDNLLGSSPQTMAFSLAMALGYAVTAAVPGLVPVGDPPIDPDPTRKPKETA